MGNSCRSSTTSPHITSHERNNDVDESEDSPHPSLLSSSNSLGIHDMVAEDENYEENEDALVKACQLGNHTKVKKLLKDAPVNSRNFDSPLLNSVRFCNENVVRSLVELGANVNASNKDGDTPLHYACFGGRSNIVSFLLSEGATISPGNKHGDTPLHEASKYVSLEVVKLMLDAGADMEAKNKIGKTVLMTACGSRRRDIVMLLLDRGACLNARDSAGRTALRYAMISGDWELLSYLRSVSAIT